MRLLSSEIDKRIVVSLDKSIRCDEAKGIMTFGKKNDYPQTIEGLINGSKTAKAVAKVYARFLSGLGFENEIINDVIVGKDIKGTPITVKKLLRQIAASIAKNNGVYIHCNENLDKEVGTVQVVPFKKCRFTKIDDSGYSPKIAVYDNWHKETGEKFDKNKIRYYNVFNLNEQVFVSQVNELGGLEKFGKEGGFRGQIYFHFMDEDYLYPLSPFDPVYLDLDTEQQVSLFKNNQARNGMLKKTILRMAEPSDPKDKENLEKTVTSWMGVDGISTLTLYDDLDPQTGDIKKSGAFATDTIDSNVEADTFQNWTKELANDIRKVINALPAILIDYEENKLGTTSGEAVQQAVNFFNAMTEDDRTAISQIFKDIFRYSNLPELKNNQNWNIKPLKLNVDTANIQPATGN